MNNTGTVGREPRFQLVKRVEMTRAETFLLNLYAILIAIVAGGILIACIGINPISFYGTVISGCFRTALSIKSLIRIIVPLLIASIAVIPAFRMKFWNIGGEGQFIMGAVFASFVALFFPESIPHWLLLLLMALAGIIGGGIWALVPAFFKCRFGTNETLLTLMLNYIALYIVQYLRDGPWRDPAAGGFPKIAKFPERAWLDQIFGLDISWIVAIALVVFMAVYLKRTKHGYEIAVVGESINTARYAGMNVNAVIMRTMFISGAIAGLGGMLQVSGEATTHTLSMGIASGVGFTAIIVVWLAKLSPLATVAVAALIGMLDKGCGVAESTYGLSSAVSDILQGIILFTVLGAMFFTSYKIVLRSRKNTDTDNKAASGGESK
ncbi:MAG: ABC transporter permease [Eubacteriales bacterium]|jgi:ABC-type uncharacterized transport system permease subunit|nr:ABC transporter permease [Clostridiales bacterium]